LSLAYYALIDQRCRPTSRRSVSARRCPGIARARELFQSATRAPDLAEAWAGLGSTYLYRSGIWRWHRGARARRLMPTRIDIAHNLAEPAPTPAGAPARRVDRAVLTVRRPRDARRRQSILFRGDLAGVEARWLGRIEPRSPACAP
jgi:hypothetical protein